MASAIPARYSKQDLLSLFKEHSLPAFFLSSDIDEPIISKESLKPFDTSSDELFDFAKGLVAFNASPTAAKPYHKQGFKPNNATGTESPGREDWGFKRPYHNNKWTNNHQNEETKIERSPLNKQKLHNKEESSPQSKEHLEPKAENIEAEVLKLLDDLAIDKSFSIWYFLDMKGKTQGPVTSNELIEYTQWGFINSESKIAIEPDKDDTASFKTIKTIDNKKLKEFADAKMKVINDEKERVENEKRKEAEKKAKEENDARLKAEAEAKKKDEEKKKIEDEAKRKADEQKKKEDESARKKAAEAEKQKKNEPKAKEAAQKQEEQKKDMPPQKEEVDEWDMLIPEQSQKKQKKAKPQKFAKPKGSNKNLEDSSPEKKTEEKKKEPPVEKKSATAVVAPSPRKQEKPVQPAQTTPSAAKVAKPTSTTNQTSGALDFQGWDIEEPKKVVVPSKPLTLDEIQKLELEEQMKRGPAPVKPKPISMPKPESDKSWWYGAENNSTAAQIAKKQVTAPAGSKAVSLEDIMKEEEKRKKKK